MSDFGQGGDYVLQLDAGAVNRVFEGDVAPDDPDVLREVATLFEMLAAPNGDREPAPGVVAALSAAVRARTPARTATPPATRRRSAAVIGAFAAGTVVGISGLAAADVLPDSLQHVTAVVLDKVGVQVADPHEANATTRRRTDPGGRPATPPGRNGEQPGNRPEVPPGQVNHESVDSPSDTAPGQLKPDEPSAGAGTPESNTHTSGTPDANASTSGSTGDDSSVPADSGGTAPADDPANQETSAGSPSGASNAPESRPAEATSRGPDDSGRPSSSSGQESAQASNRPDAPPGQEKAEKPKS
jgi:hypothetical protein